MCSASASSEYRSHQREAADVVDLDPPQFSNASRSRSGLLQHPLQRLPRRPLRHGATACARACSVARMSRLCAEPGVPQGTSPSFCASKSARRARCFRLAQYEILQALHHLLRRLLPPTLVHRPCPFACHHNPANANPVAVEKTPRIRSAISSLDVRELGPSAQVIAAVTASVMIHVG